MNRRRLATALASVSLAVARLTGLPARATSGPVTTWGYIPTDDGIQLRYTLMRPNATDRFPVALTYAPYQEGSDPLSSSANSQRLLDAGYAVVGVNVRGTGCSTGSFADIFDSREAADGAEAVEWLAAQPWSTGHVGMFGLSAPAMFQFGPAALAPPHLDAIAPFQPAMDIYRDVGLPGGILDPGFAVLWGDLLQPESSDRAAATAIANQGDSGCAAPTVDHQIDTSRYTLGVDILQHPFDGDFYWQRNPRQFVAAVNVPVLGCVAWQDDEVGSRSFYNFDALPTATTWEVLTNGYHGVCDAENVAPMLIGFFDHFVKGVANDFESTPHVTVIHDAHASAVENVRYDAYLATPSTAAWETVFSSWPVPVDVATLHLGAESTLRNEAPTGTDSGETYVAPLVSSANENGSIFGQVNAGWKVPNPPGSSLTYTTPALAHDAEFFGPGSANLWLASTATDTDVQITLSDVRADGQEVYVQRGWLRASHRALDPTLSTALRPYQTHQAADTSSLDPGQPTLLRIELFPFGYVFRAGSSIRLTIESPTSEGAWVLEPSTNLAANTILHDADHDSQLVLGRVPGGHAEADPQPCDTLLNQPCRPNVTPVPSGQLDLS